MAQGKSALGIVRKYYPNVTRVVDAKSSIKIEVTAEDCKAGKRKGVSSCAMARAFQREYDGAIISLSKAYLIKGNKATRYTVPQAVSREIVAFDRAKKFEPGVYRLAKNQYELGTIRNLRKGRHVNAKGERYVATKKYHKTAGIRAL